MMETMNTYCGTDKGYMKHWRAGEPACDACIEAQHKYRRELRAKKLGMTLESYDLMRKEQKEASKCGTHAGHVRHIRANEIPCSACLDAKNLYGKSLRAKKLGVSIEEYDLMMKKEPASCGTVAGYYRHTRAKESACDKCKKAISEKNRGRAKKNPEAYKKYRKKSWLKNIYGISIEEYEAMKADQLGVCAICGKQETASNRELAVDHDHSTGAVRGLLCTNCNLGLGNLQDDPDIVRRALEYLEKTSGQPS